MMRNLNRMFSSSKSCCLAAITMASFGCGGTETSNPPANDNSLVVAETDQQQAPPADSAVAVPKKDEPKRTFTAPQIGTIGNTSQSTESAVSAKGPQTVQEIIEQLKPIQIMLGKWRGTTRKEYDGFKAVDSHEWVWDLTTEKSKPALVMASNKSPYMKSARLTTGTTADDFVLTVTTPDGKTRRMNGVFTEPVADTPGDDDKLHRTFKLQFEEQSDESEKWRLTFAQQENDRYLLEVERRRGKAAFRRYDTVSTQREGTSFALSDSDYGEKTCIISQGLGTISVSHAGKTYWVCCSGCKAAFDEDPKKWIAAAKERAVK